MSPMRRWAAFGVLLIILIALPLLFRQNFTLSLLSQMGIAVIFALSYNMLLGQTGMLSFGHAVYFGLGAYFGVHALNLIGKGHFLFPVSLLPLVGGAAGLLFGIVFGYVTTKRSGTPFAMISLGIGELVAACSLMFPGFFGGEGGIATNRVAGVKWLGITYGPQVQVYYLILGWVLLSAAMMYAFTRTPLGRMANAVRDNPERAQFVGYNPQRVRFLVLVLASFFAGIAGGLAAINYEIVTSENVGLQTSGSVLLMTFIGGIGNFFGPILGAILVTFLQVALSGYTKAWLLYFGLFFLAMVLYAPEGLSGLIMRHRPVLEGGLMRRLLPAYGLAAGPLLIAVLGLIGLVEIVYNIETQAGAGAAMKLFGFTFQTRAVLPWLICLAFIAAGTALFLRACASVVNSWAEVNHELLRRAAP